MQEDRPVAIQEPPLQELEKKQSCVQRGCMTGCGCLLFFACGAILFLLFATNQYTETLDDIPPSIADIPLYDKENISTITRTPGIPSRPIRTSIRAFTYTLTAPIRDIWNAYQEPLQHATTRTPALRPFQPWIPRIDRRLTAPPPTTSDVIDITWSALPAQPNFIIEYYEKAFEKQKIDFETTAAPTSSLTFTKDARRGYIRVIDTTPAITGTDVVTMHITVPSAP